MVGVLEESSPVKEAQISVAVRGFRTAIVKWWRLVRADGAALTIVEDDLLVKDLQELAMQHCAPEEFKDCLEQGLKCETDK